MICALTVCVHACQLHTLAEVQTLMKTFWPDLLLAVLATKLAVGVTSCIPLPYIS